MTAALAHMPITDDRIMSELRWRTSWRGSSTAAARELGISRSHLLGIVNGNAKLSDMVRQVLLARIRAEELALADKIEAEWDR